MLAVADRTCLIRVCPDFLFQALTRQILFSPVGDLNQMTRYCTKCGATNDEAAQYCTNCQAALSPVTGYQTPPSTYQTPGSGYQSPVSGYQPMQAVNPRAMTDWKAIGAAQKITAGNH